MRIFKGFLKAGECFVALNSCQDGMKGSENYSTADNLIEIESARLKIIETKNNNNDIFVVAGESPSHRYDIRAVNAKQDQVLVINPIENNKIKAECLWDGQFYKQSRRHHTTVALHIDNTITIDLQLRAHTPNEYLAFTLTNQKVPH